MAADQKKLQPAEHCPENCDISPLKVAGGTVLAACGIHYTYPGGERAVAGVSFDLKAGESVALCGPNGSGKTTLLKLLAGLLPPDQGRVILGGVELTASNAAAAFRTIGLLFQDSQDQLFCSQVAEDVAYGPLNLGMPPAEAREMAMLALKLVEADHLASRPIHHLSGGEMKRVALAGLIAMRAPALVLDEPTNGLDPSAAEHLISLIQHLNHHHGYAFIIVTHQMDLVPRLVGRVMVLNEGQLMADGPAREILTDIPLLELARLKPPPITKYFYEISKRSGVIPGDLPLTVDEALKL